MPLEYFTPLSWNFSKNKRIVMILTATKFLIILYGKLKLETLNVVPFLRMNRRSVISRVQVAFVVVLGCSY